MATLPYLETVIQVPSKAWLALPGPTVLLAAKQHLHSMFAYGLDGPEVHEDAVYVHCSLSGIHGHAHEYAYI